MPCLKTRKHKKKLEPTKEQFSDIEKKQYKYKYEQALNKNRKIKKRLADSKEYLNNAKEERRETKEN